MPSASSPSANTVWPDNGRQAVQVLVVGALAAGLAFVVDLLLLTLFPNSHGFFERLMEGRLPSGQAGWPIALASFVVTPLIVGHTLRRQNWRSPRGLAILGLVIAALLVGNLLLMAYVPSVFDGFITLTRGAFWSTFGFSAAIIIGTAFAIGLISWRVKANSVRAFVVLSLAIAAVLVLDLVLVAFFPSIVDGFAHLPPSGNDTSSPPSDLLMLLVLLGLVPAALYGLLTKLLHRSWWWIASGYLAVAPVLAYLATDDSALRRPITTEEIAPAFPGADASFEVLMRYGSQHPLGKNFHGAQKIWKRAFAPDEAMDPGKPDQWRNWLVNHRSDIEADWADLAPVLEWWRELNTFDRLGDLTPPGLTAEMMGFSAPRTMTQLGCAMASLQALDGQGDAAVDTLLPILQVGRKLQSSGRTLVRLMIAIIIERMSVETAGFILDHATISPASRARLAAALATPGGGPAGARRLLAVEYANLLATNGDFFVGSSLSEKHLVLRSILKTLSPFLYNPRATLNTYGDEVAELQELMANRELKAFANHSQRFVREYTRPRFKNFMGSLFMRMATPAYDKVGESYWKTQDARAALLARVTQP